MLINRKAYKRIVSFFCWKMLIFRGLVIKVPKGQVKVILLPASWFCFFRPTCLNPHSFLLIITAVVRSKIYVANATACYVLT